MKIAIIKNNINSFEKMVTRRLREKLKESPLGTVDVYDLYKSDILSRGIILLEHQRLDFFGLSKFCYGKWKDMLINYDVIIVFDNGIECQHILELREMNPNARMIFWNWNTGLDSTRETLLRTCNYEIWGFDHNECCRRGFLFNRQFCFCEAMDLITEKKYKYDIFFVGADKGRSDLIFKLIKLCKDNNLRYYVKIKTLNIKKVLRNPKIYTFLGLNYKKVLHKVATSRCILDIVKEGQNGLTIRSMEAYYFSKKIITNLEKDNYEGFENASILTVDEIINNHKVLSTFIGAKVEQKTDDWNNEYSIDSWFVHFFDKKQETKEYITRDGNG